MRKLTVSFDAFDIVAVPFPFTDGKQSKRRPAMIVSPKKTFNMPVGHSVMAMITSAKNPSWPLDVAISDLQASGLPAPSVIRMKLFTLDNRFVLKQIGTLSSADRQKAKRALRALLLA
jgi:mRNA interferase MazF